MSRTRSLVLVAMAALAAAAPRARAAGGSDSLEFLSLDGHARPSAMGGAYSALASDASALRYNPAGLGLVRVNEVSLTHNQFVQGVTHQQVSGATRRGFGAELSYLDFGKVQRTTLSQPDGTGDRAGLSDFSVAVGYGHRLGPLALGAAGKFFQETADRTAASGFAGDFGVIVSPERVVGLSLGVAVLNVGPDVKYQSLKQKLPATARVGAAYSFIGGGNTNTVAAELSRTRTDPHVVGLGLETVFMKSVAFRFGYTTRSDAGLGLTAGVGWLGDRLSLGYAFSPYGDLGLTHRATISLRWGVGEPGDNLKARLRSALP